MLRGVGVWGYGRRTRIEDGESKIAHPFESHDDPRSSKNSHTPTPLAMHPLEKMSCTMRGGIIRVLHHFGITYRVANTKTTLRPCHTARECHPGLDPGSHGFASLGDPGSGSGMTRSLPYCTISILFWYNRHTQDHRVRLAYPMASNAFPLMNVATAALARK